MSLHAPLMSVSPPYSPEPPGVFDVLQAAHQRNLQHEARAGGSPVPQQQHQGAQSGSVQNTMQQNVLHVHAPPQHHQPPQGQPGHWAAQQPQQPQQAAAQHSPGPKMPPPRMAMYHQQQQQQQNGWQPPASQSAAQQVRRAQHTLLSL